MQIFDNFGHFALRLPSERLAKMARAGHRKRCALGLPELEDVVTDRIYKVTTFLRVNFERVAVAKMKKNIQKLRNDILEIFVFKFSRLTGLRPKLLFDVLGGRNGGF